MKREEAILAGGCFWCMQPVFDQLEGVLETSVGFCGGHVEHPSYERVCGGATGHREVIDIIFDADQISYRDILNAFWRSIDPTQADGQFADRGEHYKTAIFYLNDVQKVEAEESKRALMEAGKFDLPVVTEILPATSFFTAEVGHQKYYEKNAIHYGLYAEGSGRKPFLRKTWGE
ncbi:MAG: peptide-methionine (S)-S-oxide reductase MsrA [Bdellovibrionales bacterium]|nr:peptide-methionine (S)-S-oxide reductase MsrA [Bdellovibrionales bacterium]